MEESVKLCLALHEPFSLQVTQTCPGVDMLATASSTVSWTVNPFQFDILANGNPHGKSRQKHVADKLALAFENRKLEWLMTLTCRKSCTIDEEGKREYGVGTTQFSLASTGSTNLKSESRLLEILKQEENVFVQVQVLEWRDEDGGFIPDMPPWPQDFETKEMKLKLSGCQMVCVDDSYSPVIASLVPGFTPRTVRAYMTITIIVKPVGGPPAQETMAMAVYKRMLEDGINSDVSIEASNGVEVKCHSAILAAHSDVFQAMFTNDMEEAKTRKIEMPDMSEEGVRGFLAFLYRCDASMAEKSCALSLELLKAGHKYNVDLLEKNMCKLLFSKPDTWYDVDVAMKLFLFVRNLDGEWEALKKKAVMVMKGKIPDLQNSVVVQQLFQEDPGAAMAFCQYILSI